MVILENMKQHMKSLMCILQGKGKKKRKKENFKQGYVKFHEGTKWKYQLKWGWKLEKNSMVWKNNSNEEKTRHLNSKTYVCENTMNLVFTNR